LSAGLEVADVFRRHGDAYRRTHDGRLGRVERRVMSAITLCRTAALGGHTEVCAECGLVRCAYECVAKLGCFRGLGLAVGFGTPALPL
jgi:Transposase zinc-binding domain